MVKAIIMDMDGTLLDSTNAIPPATKQKLFELQKKGVRLILASGRSYTRLLPYARELEMEKYNGLLIEVDGIAWYDLSTGKRHVLKKMKPEEIASIFQYLMNMECETMACFDDGLFDFFPQSLKTVKEAIRQDQHLPIDYPWTAGPWSWLADMRDGYPNIKYIQAVEEITAPINKLQIMQEEEPLLAIYDDLKQKYGNKFEIFRTTPRQLEVLPYGFSKGKTLLYLMNLNGWEADEVVAFGDGENDISMFEVVKDSFAMENAKDFVKEKAAHVTRSNHEDGIVHALKTLGY